MILDLHTNPGFPVTTPFARSLYNCLVRDLTFRSLYDDTKKVYIKAFERFQTIINLNNLSLSNFDEALADYGQLLFDDYPRPVSRTQIQRVKAFILIPHPELKNKLYRTQHILKAWKRIVPQKSATPMSRDFMLAFTHYFLYKNNHPAALCMLLSWGGLLRISEALQLKRQDISLPGDLRPYSICSNDVGIALHTTKTGPDQYSFIKDRDINKLISLLLQNTQPTESIIPMRDDSFNAELRSATTFFGLSNLVLSSHSNRIGGALHQFMNGVPVIDISIAGRWSSLPSLNHYLKNGRKWLANITMSQSSHTKIRSHKNLALNWSP